MVIVFFSFEAIEIAYTDNIDATQHILISEKSQGVFEVVKEGMKMQRFFERIAEIKSHQMVEESKNLLLQSPIFVCLSAKSKKMSQPILQSISQSFQKYVIYIKVDKNESKQLPFNRSVLIDNQVCYGQGLPQLRQKQELRFAFLSILKEDEASQSCIFIEKNANQLKELKKEGFNYIVSDFQEQTFFKAFQQAPNVKKEPQNLDLALKINEESSKFPFAKKYLQNLIKCHKQISLKQIVPYDLTKLSISSLLQDLFRQSTYYSVSPKSWAPHERSHEISAYVFHNISNMQLYLARASKIKQFTNEEQFQAKTLAYYLNFIISPASYALPQDKFASLMKFCKINSFQNKRAFFNVRPYVQGLSTINDLCLTPNDIISIFSCGEYGGRQVKGIAGFLLSSLILNDSFNIKTICEQTALLSVHQMTNQIEFLNKNTLNQNKGPLSLCRIDFFSPLDLSNYKQINTILHLSNQGQQIKISLQEVHPKILGEMRQLLYELNDQRLQMVRTLTVYYRWNTKLVNYYQVILHRLNLIQQALKEIPIHNISNGFILDTYPELACLLIKEDYSYFTVPSKNIYSPIEYTYDSTLEAPKETHNPYLVYVNKTCSFGVYNISFPILTFLQWVKSTNKYQIIEYISMINHTFEDFVIMDKRLKLQSTNDKKNAILVVDHVELCETLINRPKSNKTVLIFCLRKINQIEDIGIISSEMKRHDNFKSSDDQLINVLMRQGSRQFDEESQFQLYDWVFKQYIKIKCSLYKLNYNTALQFAWVLHKAISTNRHRLKEIKQNHPNLYVYLYTLPITKDNQKVVYNYRLLEYLHMYQLFDKIMSRKWNCRLETYQNSSVAYWKSIIGTVLTIKLMKSLSEYLQLVQDQQHESLESNQAFNDCLELIRTISEPTSKQDEQKLPYSLYYEIFPKFEDMKHYNQIRQLQSNGKFLAIQDQTSVSVTFLEKNEYLNLENGQNQTIKCFSLEKNDRVSILKRQGQDVVFQSVSLSQQMPFSSHIDTNFPLNSGRVKDLLINSIKRYMKIVGDSIYLIFLSQKKLTSLQLANNEMSQQSIKEFQFEETVSKVKIIHGKSQIYLICITNESIYTISLDKSLDNKPTFLKKSSTSLGGTASVHFVQNSHYDIQILTFESNLLEITSLSSRSIIRSKRIQLPKPIKSATVNNGILFVFYHGQDSLYLYKLKEDSYERLWRYFWVEPNSQELYINGQSCCILGGSYLKKIQLKNMEKMMIPKQV